MFRTIEAVVTTVSWTEDGRERRAGWRLENGAPPPREFTVVDDDIAADSALRLARDGTALLWRGDFHNARQLLSALDRRLEKQASIDAREVAEQVVRLIHGDSSDRPVQRLHSVEGKPWEMVNVDGRINPSSYVVQSVRWARKDALELVQSAAYADPDKAAQLGDERLSQVATELGRNLMWAAGRVQQAALGYQRQTEPSWREASKWVAQVAHSELPFSLDFVEDRHERSEWIKIVAADAGDLYTLTLEMAAEIIGAPVGDGPDGGGAPTETEQSPAPAVESQQSPAAATSVETGPATPEQGQTLADRG